MSWRVLEWICVHECTWFIFVGFYENFYSQTIDTIATIVYLVGVDPYGPYEWRWSRIVGVLKRSNAENCHPTEILLSPQYLPQDWHVDGSNKWNKNWL
jgi:hypothetical protein